jgi:hypothetical protein
MPDTTTQTEKIAPVAPLSPWQNEDSAPQNTLLIVQDAHGDVFPAKLLVGRAFLGDQYEDDDERWITEEGDDVTESGPFLWQPFPPARAASSTDALRQGHADLLEAAKEALEELCRVSPSRDAPKLRAAIAKSEAAS